eukprot:4353662-Pyramimonas_sp.AAC.1
MPGGTTETKGGRTTTPRRALGPWGPPPLPPGGPAGAAQTSWLSCSSGGPCAERHGGHELALQVPELGHWTSSSYHVVAS